MNCSLQLLERAGSDQERLEQIQNLAASLWEGLRRLPGVQTVLEVPPPGGPGELPLPKRPSR